MDPDPFARDILALGRDDEVSLSEITSIAFRKYAADQPVEVVREMSLAVVERLVRQAYVRVGVFSKEGAFVDRSGELAVVFKEVREYDDASPRGMWRHLFYVVNTPAGDRQVDDVPEEYDPFEEDWRTGG